MDVLNSFANQSMQGHSEGRGKDPTLKFLSLNSGCYGRICHTLGYDITLHYITHLKEQEITC